MSSGIVESAQTSSSASSESQPQQQQAVSRARLVQRLLAAGGDLPAFVRDLLTTQAVVVAGTEAAAFLIDMVPVEAPTPTEDVSLDADSSTDGSVVDGTIQPKVPPQQGTQFRLQVIEHIRPDQTTADIRQAALKAFADIVKPCILQNQDGVTEIGIGGPREDNEPQYCLVTLLRTEGRVVAVSAVITRCRDTERAQQRLHSMQLVAGYFELYSLRRNNEQARDVASTHQYVLQLATSVATAEGFDAATMNFANELVTRTAAARVSIGWLKGNRIKLKAISHSEEFDRKQELSVQLERVMEECFDQGELVQFNPVGEPGHSITREAEALSRMNGGGAVLSLPLHRAAEVQGVVTLEFPADRPLNPRAATALAVATELVSPQLYDRYQNDRWLITKAGVSLKHQAELAIGPKHMLAKSIIVLSIVAILIITLYRPMFHVTAPFAFVPVDKRTLSTPFDGYIATAPHRAGDHVNAGDVLLTLDTRDVVLEKLRYEAEAAARFDEAQKDLDDPTKRAEYKQAMQEREVALREAALRQARIDRATIKAPYDGIVLSGDFRDKINAPVKQGDTLFDMSEHGLVAELSVAERDIQWLNDKGGQMGELATTSSPNARIAFHITRIVPLGTPKEGDNVFVVRVTPDQVSEQWRPGMEGEAKVNVKRMPVIWIWTHRLIEFLRLKLWI